MMASMAGVVLMYHSINRVPSDPFGLRVSPRNFAAHMRIVAEIGAVTLSNMIESDRSALAKGMVAVTFDDGYADNYTKARPVLQRFGVPATVFVTTRFIDGGREMWWDRLERALLSPTRLPRQILLQIGLDKFNWDIGGEGRRSQLAVWRQRRWRAWWPDHPGERQRLFVEIRERLKPLSHEVQDIALANLWNIAGLWPEVRPSHRGMTRQELIDLASTPGMEIGGHTIHHPSLGSLSPRDQHREIDDGKSRLEAIIQRPVTAFCYPFGSAADGDYTDETAEIVRRAGYTSACTTDPRSIETEVDRFRIPRRNVLDWSGREFAAKLRAWLDSDRT